MATMAPHVVKLVELPDGPGSTSEAQVGLSDGVQDSQEGGAKGASESAPGTGTAAEASVGGLSRTPESSDCLREDWGPAAVGPQAVRRESAGGAPCENGAERAGREKSAPDACTGAAEQDASPLAPGNIIVKLVDKVLPGPASAPRVDQKSAAGERAWVPVDDGPQIMRLSVTAIRNRVEKRRAAFAAALEAAAQRVRSDWLTQLGGSSSQKAPSNSREVRRATSSHGSTAEQLTPLGHLGGRGLSSQFHGSCCFISSQHAACLPLAPPHHSSAL